MPDNRVRAEALLDMAETWRYGHAGGAIVCDCPPGCSEDKEVEEFYGGHFVCESLDLSLATFIIQAVRRTRFPTRHA